MQKSGPVRIHPTAVLAHGVELGSNVEIGPYAVLEGNIRIGDDCVVSPGAYLYGNIVMGQRNRVFSGAVLGEQPQHLKLSGDNTGLEIGDDNIFREHVTIHRGTTQSSTTVIGSHNLFMAGSHVAHDCAIGNHCILANCALVAGHCLVEDNVFLSGNSVVHQGVRIGRLALLSGCSATSKDIPPFLIQQGHNSISGINRVGLQRAGMNAIQTNAIREAFRILFLEMLLLPVALERLEKHLAHIDVIQEMLAFLRKCEKGINLMRDRRARDRVAA